MDKKKRKTFSEIIAKLFLACFFMSFFVIGFVLIIPHLSILLWIVSAFEVALVILIDRIPRRYYFRLLAFMSAILLPLFIGITIDGLRPVVLGGLVFLMVQSLIAFIELFKPLGFMHPKAN